MISKEQELEEEMEQLENYIDILLKEKRERIERVDALAAYTKQLENSIRVRDDLLKRRRL